MEKKELSIFKPEEFETVFKLNEALINRDTDKISGLMTEDIVHESIWHEKPVYGKENVIEYYKRMFENYNEQNLETWGEFVAMLDLNMDLGGHVSRCTDMKDFDLDHAAKACAEFGKFGILLYVRDPKRDSVDTTLFIPTFGENYKLAGVFCTYPNEYKLLNFTSGKIQ